MPPVLLSVVVAFEAAASALLALDSMLLLLRGALSADVLSDLIITQVFRWKCVRGCIICFGLSDGADRCCRLICPR